jgi:hypothetical protein
LIFKKQHAADYLGRGYGFGDPAALAAAHEDLAELDERLRDGVPAVLRTRTQVVRSFVSFPFFSPFFFRR